VLYLTGFSKSRRTNVFYFKLLYTPRGFPKP